MLLLLPICDIIWHNTISTLNSRLLKKVLSSFSVLIDFLYVCMSNYFLPFSVGVSDVCLYFFFYTDMDYVV